MERGVYRGVFSSLADDPDFQRLSPQARLTFYTCRLCKQAGPAVIFRYYPAVLAEQTGLTARALEGALKELERGLWIEREGVVLWVRNGLRYDPSIRLADPKHRKAIQRQLAELPKLKIVLTFCDYYEIARGFEAPSETRSDLALREGDRDRVPRPIPSNPSPRAEEAAWGSPAALVKLYNTEAPDNVPAVEELSEKRREKCRRALRQFPLEAWWREVFVQYRRSKFLRGAVPAKEGHTSFRPDFDWLLSTGRNGVENFVKVHDGMYAD